MPQLTAHGSQGQTSVTIDCDPDTCPVCLNGVQPKELNTAQLLASRLMDRAMQCPLLSCQRVFVARYVPAQNNTYRFADSVPRSKPKAQLPRLVATKYPQFMEIYSQALYAESMGLLEICGAGFRRSLEFLIKTYVGEGKDETTTAEIGRLMLGACIAKYVSNPNLKQVAERAAWLGNDETHFERRWEDKDLQDLKRLIDLTASWIETELQTAEIIASMPDPKASTGPTVKSN